MSRRNNQNNQYNGNQYYGNGQYYNGNNGNNNQYYNQNGQYNNGQYNNGQYNQNMQYNQNGQYYNQNGQYYNQNNQNNQKNNKFGLYNQYNQENKKKDKKPADKSLLIKIVLFAVLCLVVILIVFLINSCSNTKEECAADFRKAGDASVGYVCIPSNWVSFEEDPPNRSVQYSDVDGTYIVTMDALPTTTISANDYALGIASNLEQAGITVTGSTAKIGKYEAKEIYGQTSDNVWILAYFFEADDGNTHYLGVEGPDKNNEAFKVPESFMSK